MRTNEQPTVDYNKRIKNISTRMRVCKKKTDQGKRVTALVSLISHLPTHLALHFVCLFKVRIMPPSFYPLLVIKRINVKPDQKYGLQQINLVYLSCLLFL